MIQRNMTPMTRHESLEEYIALSKKIDLHEEMISKVLEQISEIRIFLDDLLTPYRNFPSKIMDLPRRSRKDVLTDVEKL